MSTDIWQHDYMGEPTLKVAPLWPELPEGALTVTTYATRRHGGAEGPDGGAAPRRCPWAQGRPYGVAGRGGDGMSRLDDDRTLSLSTAELVERDGPELLALNLRAEILRRRAATARYWEHLTRFERANATGLTMWRAVQDAHRAGRKNVRVADLLTLTGTRPKGMTPDERVRLAGVIETGLARLDRDLLTNTRLTWALVNAIEDAGCALIEEGATA